MQRRDFAKLTLLAATVLLLARPAFAREPEIYQEGGIAIDGSDPVGYFTANGPVAGKDFTVDHKGATWRFVTLASADAFRANPAAYEPAFGGYCAFAASRGYLAPTTPEAWTIYEDRLYLNASLRARELWLEDVPGNISKGEANWPGILS